MSNHDNKDNNKITHSVEQKKPVQTLYPIIVQRNWLNNNKSIIMRLQLYIRPSSFLTYQNFRKFL